MELNDYRGDENLEEHGTWMALDDAEFLIAAHMNKRHRKALDKLRIKLAGGLRKQDPKAGEELTIKAAAVAILLGWRGNVTVNGQVLPYSPENAETLLRVRFIRDWVLEQAVNVQNFKAGEEAADTATLKSGAGVVAGVGGEPGLPGGS